MQRMILRAVLVIGVLCLLGSLVSPWLLIPTATADTQHRVERPSEPTSRSPAGAQATPGIHGESPRCQAGFKGMLLATALASGLCLRGRRVGHGYAAAAASCGLGLVFFFPYFQMVHEPALAARAAWLHIQHENLTWLGGDIFRNQELERVPAHMQLHLSDTPRQVAVIDLPSWAPWQVDVHHLSCLISWLGYTDAFCQFVARGWWLALLGMTGLLLNAMLPNGRMSMISLRSTVRVLLGMVTVGALLAWVPPLRASLQLAAAADCTYRGDHARALDWLLRATQTWKPLQEDTWYVAQRGLTESMLQVPSPYARLHVARRQEQDRQYDLAVSTYRELAQDTNLPPALQREACRGVLRHAVHAVNSGNWEQAVRGFQTVLQQEPCNIKALYALHLCHIQLGDPVALRRISHQLRDVYAYLNYPNKRIVLAKACELSVKAMLVKQHSREAFGHQAQLQQVQSPPIVARKQVSHD